MDLTLVPEVEARRALGGNARRLSVLAPYGAWMGRGKLRVLRLHASSDGSSEIVAGYESYQPLDSARDKIPKGEA